jgi:hypothetical protein
MAITEEPVLRLFDSEAKETIAKINASGKGLGAVLKDKPGKEYMVHRALLTGADRLLRDR